MLTQKKYTFFNRLCKLQWHMIGDFAEMGIKYF